MVHRDGSNRTYTYTYLDIARTRRCAHTYASTAHMYMHRPCTIYLLSYYSCVRTILYIELAIPIGQSLRIDAHWLAIATFLHKDLQSPSHAVLPRERLQYLGHHRSQQYSNRLVYVRMLDSPINIYIIDHVQPHMRVFISIRSDLISDSTISVCVTYANDGSSDPTCFLT